MYEERDLNSSFKEFEGLRREYLNVGFWDGIREGHKNVSRKGIQVGRNLNSMTSQVANPKDFRRISDEYLKTTGFGTTRAPAEFESRMPK